MDPHSYRPNEFFISNWIYEGLVSYGYDGQILPQLAQSWTVTTTNSGSQEYRFTLRSGVKFHDGTVCNCYAVKMTFDHVLQNPLNTVNYHGWYHLPLYLTSWECQGEVFVVTMSDEYYPLLQELSLIRPLRVLSPNCYADGSTSSPVTANSCPTKWDPPSNMDGSTSNVRCRSVNCSIGTGPWKYSSKTLRTDGTVEEMRLLKNSNWWGTHGGVTELVVKGYTSADDVKQALLGGQLDMVVGGGVLTPQQVQDFTLFPHFNDFVVSKGPPLLNTIIVMNAAKAPTDNVQLRTTIMHAVNKANIVDVELVGSSVVADSLFPKDAPYCNVDLTPRWDYDIEKARLINCPTVLTADQADDETDTGLIVGLSLGIGIPVLLIIGGFCFCIGKQRGYTQLSNEGAKKSPTPSESPTPSGDVVGNDSI
jgi:nickel transport system substrate-binding protein